MNRREILALGSMAASCALFPQARAQGLLTDDGLSGDAPNCIALWPGTPPGGAGVQIAQQIEERSKDPSLGHDRSVVGVPKPFLMGFRPVKPDGSAVIVIPGGAYGGLAIDKEGIEVARLLCARGVTAFVLLYRLPAQGWHGRADVPLQDGQRALRLVRAQAESFGIDKSRVGVVGFSAGGHLAASLATRFAQMPYVPVDAADQIDARPSFAGLIYPVITMDTGTHLGSRTNLLGPSPEPQMIARYSCDRLVTPQTSPSFICCANDDHTVPVVENAVAMYLALMAKGVPVEMHAFPEGGHGFGLRMADSKPCGVWPELFLVWGKAEGWFDAVQS